MFNFKNFSLGNKLLTIFLITGILPVTVVITSAAWQSQKALSDQAFSQLEGMREVKREQIEDFFLQRKGDMQVLLQVVANLRQNAWQRLQSVQENKAAQVEDYFRARLNDLDVLSRTEAVAHVIDQFSEAFELDGGMAGITWESIKGMVDTELQHYRKTLGYDDLLLINLDGMVVYTTTQGEDFGADLINGEQNTTALATAVQTVLEEQKPMIQDFSAYAPIGGGQAMFFLSPILRFDKPVGLLAFRVGTERLDEIVQRRKGMGESGESYLTGKRKGLQASYRSTRKLPGNRGIFAIGSEVAGDDVEAVLKGRSGKLWKYGENGRLRISAYTPLYIPGLQWGLITSMDVEEILTPRLEGEEQDFFSKYATQYGLFDLFLIHPKGKIFYSVKKGPEYETNIRNGEYAGTQLGQVVAEVLLNPGFRISDYAPYEPSGDIPSAFIAQPLLDDQGNIELVVAVQLTEEALNLIMQQRAGMGKTGETYLVGKDLLMRSNSYLSPQTHSIRTSFLNPKSGSVDTDSVHQALTGNSGRMISRNYRGDEVLSAYTPIQVGDTTWALIAEIHTSEAFAPIFSMQMIMAGIVLLGALVVWQTSRRFTSLIVVPLTQVNNHLKSLAAGDPVAQDIVYHGNDEITELVTSAIKLRQAMEITIGQANAVAAGDYSGEVRLLSERDQLGRALSDMTLTLRHMTENNALQTWLKSGQAELNQKMSGVQDISTLTKNIVEFLARYLEAQVGVFYVIHHKEGQETLKLMSSYAYTRRKGLSDEFLVGEGLVGQAALEKEMILVSDIPEDYIHVQSGMGDAVPRNIVVLPVLYENQLKGIVELGSFEMFSDTDLEFLKQAEPGIGIGLYTAESRTQLQSLLTQSQSQAEELQSQAEELQVQQEELRQSNEELEERTTELETQRNQIRTKNEELEKTQKEIEQKAYELELASKYKSEFLANMSHELRTPLNSLLILAQLLGNNKDGNLNDKQVEYAKTIHHAGNDLLSLINEILDLSKIEAGKIELSLEQVSLESFINVFKQRFQHVAEDKGLEFLIQMEEGLPPSIVNDGQRLQQVVTNLISNALKFTDRGGRVTLAIRRPTATDTKLPATVEPEQGLIISVSDSGIGIPEDKQAAVFEAFQQADGSTSRKYGGTGLGLSISRQLVHLMGGEIGLHSVPGEGSTFTLYLPDQVVGSIDATAITPATLVEQVLVAAPEPQPAAAAVPAAAPPTPTPSAQTTPATPFSAAADTSAPAPKASADEADPEVDDDRADLQPGERSLLVVEDDPDFSKLLVDLAREKQYKCILAQNGRDALQLAQTYQPSAIVLDIGLPLVDGWTVLERLKEDSATRHIPIHCVSGSEHDLDARRMGAIGYLLKPVGMTELGNAFKKIEEFLDNDVKNLLVVADSGARQDTIVKLVDSAAVEPSKAANAEEAWRQLANTAFDTIILDAGSTPGKGHLDLLAKLQQDEQKAQIPVILYSDRELNEDEENRIRHCTEHMVIKSVRSPERLLDEATLFLHQIEAKLPPEQQQMLHMVHNKEAILAGKKVMVVDDDMRNIYSLTAILEEREMVVSMAKNGIRALELLEEVPEVDMILMDIMMPEMDGYETMRRIREQSRFKKTPIIALTAKAMKGDKAKCIEAGANDYLAKPVDADKLLSLMRVWLYR